MMGLASPIYADEKATSDFGQLEPPVEMNLACATNVAPVPALSAQTPYGTFGCGQAEKALLRTRHFDVLGKGMALFSARPTQPGLSHLEATLKRTGERGGSPCPRPSAQKPGAL